jgi:hypothetical protein
MNSLTIWRCKREFDHCPWSRHPKNRLVFADDVAEGVEMA